MCDIESMRKTRSAGLVPAGDFFCGIMCSIIWWWFESVNLLSRLAGSDFFAPSLFLLAGGPRLIYPRPYQLCRGAQLILVGAHFETLMPCKMIHEPTRNFFRAHFV